MSCFSNETLEGIQCLFFFLTSLSNLSKQGLQTGALQTQAGGAQGAYNDGPRTATEAESAPQSNQ